MAWPTGMREVIYELRAQGMTLREIDAALPARFPGSPTPDYRTIHHWLTDPTANALVRQAETRIRAIATQRTVDVIGNTYDGLAEAIAQRDAKSVDAWSRAVVNLTRGFVQDRLEVAAPPGDAVDELAGLLKRHGVSLAQTTQQSAGESETGAQ